MKPGEPFNAHRRLVQIMVPVSLIGAKGLIASDLLLYGRLQLHKGKGSDSCFVGLDKLAEEMHVDVASIGRGLNRLCDAGLIARKRQGRGRVNVYAFLWADLLTGSLRGAHDSASVRNQEGSSDSAPMRDQGAHDSASVRPMIPHPCSFDSASVRSAYKEEKIPEKIPIKDSSSSSVSGSTGEPEKPTTTTALSESQKPTPKPELPDEALDPWREWLFQKRYPDGDGRRLDAKYARKLLGLFSSAESAQAYMAAWKPKRFKAPNYGLFQSDIELWERTWPESRKDLEARATEAREREEVELRKAAIEAETEAVWRRCYAKGWKEIFAMRCPNCAGFGRNPDTGADCSCAAGLELVRQREYCRRCRDQGTVETAESQPAFPMVTWCNCLHAERKRAKEPDYCETFNAMSMETRRKCNGKPHTPRPAAKVTPIRDADELERRLAEELPAREVSDEF
jgi:hypothetical protein